ncbi:MAG: hypothetical protein HOI66_21940 [Verrucomicrobia bacterium]|nr:hypothetical protein [Verrucomicrobiota bacterium]
MDRQPSVEELSVRPKARLPATLGQSAPQQTHHPALWARLSESAFGPFKLPVFHDPQIPKKDREELGHAHLVGAGIALDLLSTITRPILFSPTALEQIALALLAVGDFGRMTPVKRQDLMQKARGQKGDDRKDLNRRLAPLANPGNTSSDPQPVTIEGLQRAFGHIHRATELVLEDTYLHLNANATVDYFQA